MRIDFVHVVRLAVPFGIALAMLTFAQGPARADSPAQMASCGSVDLNGASSTDATRAFDCFSTAFKGCTPATLGAQSSDADVATSWSFSTVDGGDDHGCSISEVVETTSRGTKTTDSYLCRTLSRDNDGTLHFGGCGSGKDVALRVGSMLGASPGAAATASAAQATPKN
jgi:hypothetical protein